MRLLRRLRERDDRGMVTAFVTITSVTLLFVAGMVFDGGRILAEKRETLNIAESAARAGAQALDEDAIRAHNPDVLDEARAVGMACTFLNEAGRSCGDASISAPAGQNRITVNLTSSVDPTMMPPGVGRQVFTLSGTACVAHGITGAEPTTQC
jgi:Flp pilus assembly protein TadG